MRSVLSRRSLTASRLESAVRSVLEDSSYRQAAQMFQQFIRQIDGPAPAAGVIEEKLSIQLAATA